DFNLGLAGPGKKEVQVAVLVEVRHGKGLRGAKASEELGRFQEPLAGSSPINHQPGRIRIRGDGILPGVSIEVGGNQKSRRGARRAEEDGGGSKPAIAFAEVDSQIPAFRDRKSKRLNSSHEWI